MDNFSAYLLGLLAMMAIEWPFSLLPLLIMAHLRQTKEEAPWKKPTHQHLNVRSRKKQQMPSHSPTTEATVTSTHKNSNSKQQQRSTLRPLHP